MIKINNKQKALMLSFVLAAMLLPTSARAQAYDKEAAESYNGGAFYELIAYDTYLDELANVLKAVELNRGSASISGGSITNDDFGPSPLGSGLGILLAAGAGYAVVRRKRSRKNTTLLLACLLLLGFTQCKKEQIEPQGGKVNITLNVENGASTGSATDGASTGSATDGASTGSATDGASTGSATDGAKVEVNPPHVNFETGDKILVASNGHYVGTLTHNGTNFSGSITDPVEGEPLYFYFLGNKDAGTLSAGASGSTSCTVNISDQTSELPVISMAPSTDDYSSSVTSYSASLHNKCSLMKFNVTTDSNSPIHITGMNNKVMVDFSTPEGADNGFSYDKVGDGIIKMKGGSGTNVEKWIIVLKQGALLEDANGAYSADGSYVGTRPAIDAITENGVSLSSGINMTVNTAGDRSINLATVSANTTINDGYRVYGTLGGNYKISIAVDATVTLDGVTINGTNNSSYKWAGLNCLGDAAVILADGSTNSVKGFYCTYPGIHIPSGYTLTIQGTGELNASSYDGTNGGAGIGGGWQISCGNITITSGTVTATGKTGATGIGGACYNASCGNITISGGTITATGGSGAPGIGTGKNSSGGNITISGGTVTANGGSGGAGIGSGSQSHCNAITISGGTITASSASSGAGIGSGSSYASCGVINITGGTVEATGGSRAAGIGSGYTSCSCGDITIESTVTKVKATKGENATYSIGAGVYNSSCGTVTVGGNTGAITTSPYTYQP